MRRSRILSKAARGAPASIIAGLAAALAMSACRADRVEYHKRPAFYQRASATPLPDEIVLDDGTIIKYRSTQAPGIAGLNPGAKTFQIREEHDDGKITLRALLPEHVIANALTCLRNEEYQLMYEQMLAAPTRQAYDDQGADVEGGGLAAFTGYMRQHRHDLANTLARMTTGFTSQEVKLTNLGDGVTRCSLRPQIAGPFRFKVIDVVKEGGNLKLLMVR